MFWIACYLVCSGIAVGVADVLEPRLWDERRDDEEAVILVVGVGLFWPAVLPGLLTNKLLKKGSSYLSAYHDRKLAILDRKHEHQMKELSAAKEITTD